MGRKPRWGAVWQEAKWKLEGCRSGKVAAVVDSGRRGYFVTGLLSNYLWLYLLHLDPLSITDPPAVHGCARHYSQLIKWAQLRKHHLCSSTAFQYAHTCVSVYLVAQSCPTFCNLMDCNLPGSSVHRSFQARILEWVAISQPRNQTCISCIPCIGR